MNNPWNNIQNGCQIRQDMDVNVYFAKSDNGEYLCKVDLEQIIERDIELSLKGIDIRKINKENSSIIVLILKTENNWEIFLKLCEDLVTEAKKTQKERAKAIITRLKRWQVFLQNENHTISDEIQIGLMGELIFLNEYLSQTVSLDEAINAWVGPEKEKQDFRINGISTEVKAYMDRKQGQITISSLEQLNNHDNNLFLFTVGFKSNDTGKTLKEYCRIIEDRITIECPSCMYDFEQLLSSYGFCLDIEYSNLKSLASYKIECYKVTDEFPKIPISIKQNAIINVNYKLDLAQCDNYICDIKNLINAIKEGI